MFRHTHTHTLPRRGISLAYLLTRLWEEGPSLQSSGRKGEEAEREKFGGGTSGPRSDGLDLLLERRESLHNESAAGLLDGPQQKDDVTK